MEIKFEKVQELNLEVGDMFVDTNNDAYYLISSDSDYFIVVDLQFNEGIYYTSLDEVYDAYAIKRVVKNSKIKIIL